MLARPRANSLTQHHPALILSAQATNTTGLQSKIVFRSSEPAVDHVQVKKTPMSPVGKTATTRSFGESLKRRVWRRALLYHHMFWNGSPLEVDTSSQYFLVRIHFLHVLLPNLPKNSSRKPLYMSPSLENPTSTGLSNEEPLLALSQADVLLLRLLLSQGPWSWRDTILKISIVKKKPFQKDVSAWNTTLTTHALPGPSCLREQTLH